MDSTSETLWINELAHLGAHIESGTIRHFGDAAGELRAARDGKVIAALSHLTMLEFAGEDAEAFLQGQLSCDVKALAQGAVTLGSYNTAKGRMLASFFLLRAGERFLMLLSADIAATIQKRLTMFILRAKVKITQLQDTLVLLGLSGAAQNVELENLTPTQAANMQPFQLADGRKLLLIAETNALEIWSALTTQFKPIGAPAWQWLDILHGIPFITSATQDQLVPQMTNLELIGGVSFKKGCYPGQEIVARTQYLGKVKRRMFRAHLEVEAKPGDALYSDDLGDQASGLVISSQASPEGGYELLVVTQMGSRESSTVRLKSSQGPALRFEPLPYTID
ncbi:MAG: YgfZ/GcvT domain-containing protein [Burkholderiales bacterium]